MKLSRLWPLGVLALLAALLGVMLACGDDDDDDNDDAGVTDDDAADDDDDADDDVADDDDDDDDDDSSPIPGTIAGTVVDFLSENTLKQMDVEAIQANGQPFDPAITGVSGNDGKVSLELPAEYVETTVGIKVSGAQGALVYKDTIQFGFLVGSPNETFLAISQTVFNLMASSLPTPPDADKGHVAGAVYWGDPTDETPIGCAEVTIDPTSGNVYYASGFLGLPGTDRDIQTPGDPQNGEGTDPNANQGKGVFVAINVEPSTSGVTINADADGNVESAVLPIVLADSVLIQNVYYDKSEYASDPTGAWCTSK